MEGKRQFKCNVQEKNQKKNITILIKSMYIVLLHSQFFPKIIDVPIFSELFLSNMHDLVLESIVYHK